MWSAQKFSSPFVMRNERNIEFGLQCAWDACSSVLMHFYLLSFSTLHSSQSTQSTQIEKEKYFFPQAQHMEKSWIWNVIHCTPVKERFFIATKNLPSTFICPSFQYNTLFYDTHFFQAFSVFFCFFLYNTYCLFRWFSASFTLSMPT